MWNFSFIIAEIGSCFDKAVVLSRISLYSLGTLLIVTTPSFYQHFDLNMQMLLPSLVNGCVCKSRCAVVKHSMLDN